MSDIGKSFGCATILVFTFMSQTAICEVNPTGRSLYDLSFPAMEGLLVSAGLRPIHTRALWRALYRDPDGALAVCPEFLPPLRRWVDRHLFGGSGSRFRADGLPVLAEVASSDGLTRKFLLGLADGQSVETVVMGYPGRFTACVSTQVGCAMGCLFCATGQMGFVRHLTPGEIVTQILHCQNVLRAQGEKALRNVVLMGMGEPLHNYDAVMTALEIASERRGLNIGPARITVSTVGVVPGILRLAAENRPYNLAVSLHAATDEARAALVPVSRRWPLDELIAACRTYNASTGRRVFIEWTLIAGANDSQAEAERLARLLAGLNVHVNLIALNPTNGFAGTPASGPACGGFQRTLRAAGFPSTIRQRRGIDVAAGCGQLQARSISPGKSAPEQPFLGQTKLEPL